MLRIHRLLAIDNLLDDSYNKFISTLCKEYCLSRSVGNIQLEYCYYIEFNVDARDDDDDVLSLSSSVVNNVLWLLSETFEPHLIHVHRSFFEKNQGPGSDSIVIECGPRLAFSTAWSSNCLSMFQACGIKNIQRIERSRRYRLQCSTSSSDSGSVLSQEAVDHISSFLYDRMTECIYPEPLKSFDTQATTTVGEASSSASSSPSSHVIIPVLENGINELIKINRQQGLGFDDVDLQFYYNIFINTS